MNTLSTPAAAGPAGAVMHALIAELFPICRSITGDGLRRTIQRIAEEIPVDLVEIPTGTRVFDWSIPREWNIRDAYVKNSRGERVIDFQRHNLHVVNYSVPIRATLSLDELRPHLHSLPDRPEWIPYRTSYYEESWGFCIAHRDLERLVDDRYEVCIDASLTPGSLTYGEVYLPGTSTDEVLISCHCCHPSLANDNLSGIAVAVELAKALARRQRALSYRLLFVPGTIGSIAWLAQNEDAAARIRHGLVLSCLGDRGTPSYKRSRRGTALVDRAVEHVLEHSSGLYSVTDFVPYGYDERQYCSPGFDLPVGCLTRTPNGQFAEYHTSADNIDFVDPASLEHSFDICLRVLDVLEHDATYLNLNPRCEPQLGRRGLYRRTGGTSLPGYETALLWVLNFSDGEHSLLDIAERARLPFDIIAKAARDLVTHELLAPTEAPEPALVTTNARAKPFDARPRRSAAAQATRTR